MIISWWQIAAIQWWQNVVANAPIYLPNRGGKFVVAKTLIPEVDVVANRGGKRSVITSPLVAQPSVLKKALSPEKITITMTPAIKVVASDEDVRDTAVDLKPPAKNARIEIFSRGQKRRGRQGRGRERRGRPRRIWFWRWRWQLKDKNSAPLFTKTGGYKRGSRYGGKLKKQTSRGKAPGGCPKQRNLSRVSRM